MPRLSALVVEPVNVRSRVEMGKRNKGEALARGDIHLDPVSVNIHQSQVRAAQKE